MGSTLKIDNLIESFGLEGDTKSNKNPMATAFVISANCQSDDGAGVSPPSGN
jgi:hypothetical protein